ncbi:MAG: branched-chain amino acid ABC transporter permease [Proteobacteria bacterium]|nr:branched-chain amino acid ABC transporter permease [Pseudomonadota bacterium]
MDNISLLIQAPSILGQLVLDGLLAGAIFALAAYGLALVWGVMNIINVAQGEFVILGGYVSYTLYDKFGINPLWTVPIAFVVLYAVGWLLYKSIIYRLVDRDLFTSLLATFGISILLQQLMNQVFGADVVGADAGLGSAIFAGGDIVIAKIKFVSFVLALVCGVVLVMALKRSRLGQAIRATAQDARAARIMGVDTDKVYAATFSLNSAICGVAGALVAMTWVIHPFIGLVYTVRSFMIVIIAGLGNLAAVVVSGLGLGALENVAGFVLGAEFQAAFVFGLLVVILVIRNAMVRRKRQVLS